MEPLSIVADEVALEGLDGITIPSLWIRLDAIKPAFPLKLDDLTKDFLWKSLISNSDLKFYQLPTERDDVVLFDRFKGIDPDTGIETAEKFSEVRKEVYPIHITVENKDGIQGSCALFKERTDVTQQVRSKSLAPLLNLQEALERYGRKLVVVASQALRFRTLIGIDSDPDLKLNDDSFCVLERVGRARMQGELQRDLHGCAFKIDARKLHYMRKALVEYGLITMQSHVTRVTTGQQQHSILLLLKRFHVNRRTKYDILMEYVSNILQQSPGQFATLLTLKEHLSNVNDRSLKRVFQHMRSAKLVEYCQYPLEDLDPDAGPCTNKKGNKVLVRCLKLLKPYTRKGVTEDDEDDEDDEDYDNRALPSEGRVMEKDVLSQAYHIVLSCGTKGITQRDIGIRMNVGKLEARMICRRLERDAVIKGFMVDVGRQRTTRFISHKCVGVSNQLQRVAKEQERKKLLYSAPQTSDAERPTAKTPTENAKPRAAKKVQKAGGGGDEGAKEAGRSRGDGEVERADEGLEGEEEKSGAKKKTSGGKSSMNTNQTQTEISIVQISPVKCETPASSQCTTSTTPDSESTPSAEQAIVKEEESISSPESEEVIAADNPVDNNIVVVNNKGVCKPPKARKKSRWISPRSHETYRLLRRRNLIIEAVRSFRIIEGLFPLQRIINDEEKLDGRISKCCRKTILRLVDNLSREGLLKVYKTTVIQDGITKKLEMVVHPSIQPNDEIVSRVIEQVRFKISTSYSALRLQHAEEKAREQAKGSEDAGGSASKDQKREKRQSDEFKPTTVRGLGKTFGFQPKMHRLRLVHNFLWYLIYGHPGRSDSTDLQSVAQTSADVRCSDPDAKHPKESTKKNRRTRPSEKAASGSADKQTADSTECNLDLTLSSGDEEEQVKDKATPAHSQSDLTVYVDEDSWKKFMPPVRVHKEFTSGWAMVGDLLLCLPLSIFIQVIQINYQVDGLEDYLNDPVKQHHLVRALPARIKRQLLYKRRYIFSFHENLQKLVYMGLLQFGPMEKFKEKDQVFVYLRRNAAIVDTTSAEPHYWLVTESPDKPFERRRYTFNMVEDVENYWFDLMCVCLNTPLGVIRSKRNADQETAPSFVHERNVFVGLAYLLKGCRDACDDWSIPGDGKGAGGLDSEFFAHLKRNWLWTNHLLAVRAAPSGLAAKENKIRLKSLLTKNALRLALKAGGTAIPRYVTAKRPLITETVELDVEPASRNQRVVGGKKQKRKRSKKEVVKASRKKKKEPKKRTPAHDEADHRALKMMTRQRVYWSLQEDSLMMLCSVATHLLNSKLKRPYVPYCVVRDLLHAEFEISMDKTSVAVGRRTRYILKNPQTLLNYRICLAEVYQDKPLMKLLESKKPAAPNNPEDCGKSFSEYARLLRQKFSAVLLSTRDVIMPDTKRQLFSRFKVSAIESRKQVSWKDTLNCSDDIHAIVLHNVIQSTLAMTNCQMKSSRSFQTFHMYSKYNQELLCQVFIQCRKRGLVNRRRINQPFGPKKNRALPILPMSYQLSQSYYRCFSWRFPHLLCTDSFRFLRNLINNGTGDGAPAVEFYHETENRSESGEEVLERRAGSDKEKKRQSKRKEDGQRPASEPEVQPDAANSASTKEGENDQGNAEGEEKPMEASNEKTEAASKADEQTNPEECLTAGSGEDQPSREQTDNHLPKEEELPDVSEMLRFSIDSPGGASLVSLSLMSLGLLSVYMSIPKQMVVVDSNLVDNDVVKSMAAMEDEDDDDDDGEECDGRKKLEVKAHQASHTNYLMMRGYCCPGIVKIRNLNTCDNIVVESCIISLRLRNTPAHHLFSTESSLPLDLTKCGPSLLPSVLTYFNRSPSSRSPNSVKESDGRLIQQKGYTPQDIKACAQLRRSLNAAGENGLDIRDLYQNHTQLVEPWFGRTRSLQQYLEELQEDGQMIKVGGLGVRWVLMQHADPWLLTVNSKQWSQSRFSSERHPFLEKVHNIPFMRKRPKLKVRPDADEPPAKKAALAEQGGEDRRDLGGMSSDTTKDKQLEKQKEQPGEGSGDKALNLEEEEEEEGGKLMKPEEDREQETVETEGRREEKKDRRVRTRSFDKREEEACALPSTPAGVDHEENVSFISRPWRMVDGNLNRQVCKGMLEAIMYHIMFRPGLTQQTLAEHYKDVLQPMAVLDLVQALIDMGCVTKKTMFKASKPSLFTRSVLQASPDTKVKIEDPGQVFYEPTISCCLRLSQVLPNERHWNYCIP